MGRGLADLLARDEALAPHVLGVLDSWARDDRARAAALLCFLIVTAQLTLDSSRSEDGRRAGWPTLLHLADVRSELRGPFIRLWRDALNQGDFHEEAEQVLRGWAELAEHDAMLREMFLRMIWAIAHGHERSARILMHCAHDWVEPDSLDQLPHVARAVITHLEELRNTGTS